MTQGAIRYGIPELEASIPVLRKAAKDLSGYNKKFLAGVSDTLAGAKYNSDFVSAISKATRNMEDTKAPKLLAALDDYCNAVQAATAATKGLDTKLSEQEAEIASALLSKIGGRG